MSSLGTFRHVQNWLGMEIFFLELLESFLYGFEFWIYVNNGLVLLFSRLSGGCR